MNCKEPIKNGFSIIELIIAGAISITAIGVGFSLLQIALKGNKIDETQMGLNGRINDTLDFILDEVKSSKRIIDNEANITLFNNNCRMPDEGEFLFGISIPNQALAKSDYMPKGDQLTLNQVECPIVYSLRPSQNNEKSICNQLFVRIWLGGRFWMAKRTGFAVRDGRGRPQRRDCSVPSRTCGSDVLV